MYKKIDNNISYVLKHKTPKFIINWIIILIISFTTIFLISYKYEYYKCDKYISYIKKVDDFKLYIYLKEEDIESLNDATILIEKEEYEFFVDSISDDYYLVNNDNYRLIGLNIYLEDKYLIENNVLNITLKKTKTTLLKELKKGFILWKN